MIGDRGGYYDDDTPGSEPVSDDVKPSDAEIRFPDRGTVESYSRDTLESGLREVRDGLCVGASAQDQEAAIAALHRVAATAREGLEPKRIDAAGNTQLQPGHISDEELGRFLTKQERDGTRWALCDFVSKRSGRGDNSQEKL